MRFGLRKLTLLDYPGSVAATVFTCGCNFRCPFCHNGSLVLGSDENLECDRDELLDFLKKRRKVLDAVCFTGGEPLLHKETLDMLAAVKSLGYLVKLDTNGSFPGRLKLAVDEGLVDTVAMDIKNSPGKYELTSGSGAALDQVCESVEFLLKHRLDHEFRTTVVKPLHSREDFAAIGSWLRGAKRYYLQKFVLSPDILSADMVLETPEPEELREFLAEVQKFIPQAAIRGE